MRRNAVFFIDFGLTLAVICLTLVVLAVFTPPKKDNTPPITPKAEFLITLSWNDGSDDDLDLYVRGPDGTIVFFKNKSAPYMFLDHDDTSQNDIINQQKIPSRIEVVSVRAIVPGDYTVNTHCYHKGSSPATVDHAHVRVLKLNPFSIVKEVDEDFTATGQEKTMVNFTVEPDGSVSQVYRDQVHLVGQQESPNAPTNEGEPE